MAKEGIIFNIQRYSLHDGCGIRTTVFFKGCPLRCAWCSNPESLSPKAQVTFTQENCIQCGACAAICPSGAKTLAGYAAEQCTGCLACVEACPTGCLALAGKRMSVEEVMAEVLRDIPFFQKSGGGVTLSGGEPLLQPEFAARLARQVKQVGLPLAVETAGNVPWEHMEMVLRYCDEILYDFKQMDDNLHRQYVGASNRRILENAGRAAALGKRFVARVPLIGGVNNTEENLSALAAFAVEHGIGEIHLLPYHRYGEGKYKKLNMPYTLRAYTPGEEELGGFRELLQRHNITVHINGA